MVVFSSSLLLPPIVPAPDSQHLLEAIADALNFALPAKYGQAHQAHDVVAETTLLENIDEAGEPISLVQQKALRQDYDLLQHAISAYCQVAKFYQSVQGARGRRVIVTRRVPTAAAATTTTTTTTTMLVEFYQHLNVTNESFNRWRIIYVLQVDVSNNVLG